jgi:ABC-type metal ion transport system, periplasmic component/surface antigen
MKKTFVLLLAVVLVFGLFGCQSSEKKEEDTGDKTIVVSATLDPHSKILEYAKPILAEKGYTLEIKVIDDYYVHNKALDDGEVDANYFQHVPFFNDEVAANGYDIVIVANIHVEPFGFYSKTVSSVDEIKDGAVIVISNSVSDHGRILAILEEAGLVTLTEGVTALTATTADIVDNPKNLTFKEVKPELLSIAYEQNEGDLVAINGNYAIQAGLNPTVDAVILEKGGADNPYVNVVAVKNGNENNEKIQALIDVLKSDEIKQFILDTYSDGSVIPAE